MIVEMLSMISTRPSNRAAFVSSQYDFFGKATILGGQAQAKEIGFDIWI